MKILFTSDWQADFDNLELCRRASEEILRLKDELGFGVIVLCGDLKHVYNPVDVRVVTFWLRTITAWRKAGLEVHIDLGNHDRVGMHVDKQNWFPVLRKAGAYAWDDTQTLHFMDGTGLAFLPFRNNPMLVKREASDLAKTMPQGDFVLVFHADLKKAKYNVLSYSEGSEKISVADLHADKYQFCIGGHIHFQQRVHGNVWYVGSPFATDWGEANQQKGYLLVDTKEKSLKQIRSAIPGWYDPGWPGFEEAKPKSWEGTRVRIKVPCSGVQHVREQLEAAEAEARKLYLGANVVVVPEFREEDRAGSGLIRSSYPDEKKIAIYVSKTLPEELKIYKHKITKYLIDQLDQVGGLQREHGELVFRSFRAENFLSYKNVQARFEPGLSVVSGENMDWKGRSNGSGKSSYLQPIAVALFGQTFKEQKHDKWMRRGTGKEEESFVKIWFNDSQGRLCTVRRARQPKELKLVVSNKIVETGNRPESTQKLIEQVTGYTWETLSNAIYIDQAKSHLMLTGTEAERKGFLARLQNLERFERAEKAIRVQKADFDERHMLVSSRIGAVLTEQAHLSDIIRQAKQTDAYKWDGDPYAALRQAKKKYQEKAEEMKAWEVQSEKELESLSRKMELEREADSARICQKATVRERIRELQVRLSRLDKLQSVCPTCEQPVDARYAKTLVTPLQEKIEELNEQLNGFFELGEKTRQVLSELQKEQKKWSNNPVLQEELMEARVNLESCKIRLDQREQQSTLICNLETKLMVCSQKAANLKRQKKRLSKWLSILKYAQTVFQRNGLPAYLNAQICPELNQAAAEYAELFAQSEIQVQFQVDAEGRLDVQVVNAHGGEGVEDQSEGEMKMASLITSFAVRSIAPKTNILILDEPGDGLDSTSARAFARGLKSVLKKFSSILLTTHNPAILSELADASLIRVVKENGISRVEE